MTEVLNTCMEILTFLVKKRKKKRHKVDFLTFRIVLYVSIQESQWDFTKLIRKGGSSMDDLYPVNVSPPSICWVIQPHKNPMIQSQFYLTPRVRISISSHSMRQLLHSVVWNYHTESHLSNISMLAIIGRTISTSERSRLNIDYFSH